MLEWSSFLGKKTYSILCCPSSKEGSQGHPPTPITTIPHRHYKKRFFFYNNRIVNTALKGQKLRNVAFVHRLSRNRASSVPSAILHREADGALGIEALSLSLKEGRVLKDPRRSTLPSGQVKKRFVYINRGRYFGK